MRGGLAAGVAVLMAVAPARAQPADAAAPIAALDAALVAAMKAGKTTPFAKRAAMLAPVIDAAFDLPGILKAAVGLRWAALPAGQQQALLTAFRDFTIASYASNFDSFDGQTIAVVPPLRAVGADEVVQTRIVSGSDANRVDYQMRRMGEAWKAVDVLLDGSISNVAVQRSDFRKLLGTGADAGRLLASLRQKSADLASGTAP